MRAAAGCSEAAAAAILTAESWTTAASLAGGKPAAAAECVDQGNGPEAAGGAPQLPLTLAAAEAPFADPFLMEFEDPESLNKAYQETPMTFEQALMTARLEAKMATQVPQVTPCLHPDSIEPEA